MAWRLSHPRSAQQRPMQRLHFFGVAQDRQCLFERLKVFWANEHHCGLAFDSVGLATQSVWGAWSASQARQRASACSAVAAASGP